jgi:hypothetical protein
MPDIDVLADIIYPAIDAVAKAGLIDALAKSPDTAILGDGRTLDSLQVVSLIIGVETKAREVCGVSLTLANERAMSREQSPFLTLRTLAAYVSEVLKVSTG